MTVKRFLEIILYLSLGIILLPAYVLGVFYAIPQMEIAVPIILFTPILIIYLVLKLSTFKIKH